MLKPSSVKPDDYHAAIYNAGYTVPTDRKPEHYKAVAEVIGYVMRLKAKITGGGGRR